MVELLWCDGCPNYRKTFGMIEGVAIELGVEASIKMVQVEDETIGRRYGFPGSPTVRVDGHDIEPSSGPCEDYTLRCRVYTVDGHLTGLPERSWLRDALAAAQERHDRQG